MAECTVKSPTNKHYTKIASLMAALSLWIALDKGEESLAEILEE